MIENIDILKDVKSEVVRFVTKLNKAIKEAEAENEYSKWQFIEFASAKRSAMDLKRELTKLTQSSNYKYESRNK